MPAASTPVLIVEDDKFLGKILLTKFTKEGFVASLAGTGEDAVKMAAAQTPAIVLLDLILPAMSGFEVLAELRQQAATKHVPIIVLSNLSQEEDKIRAKDLGADEYLVKSDHSINEVVAKAKEAMAKYSIKKS